MVVIKNKQNPTFKAALILCADALMIFSVFLLKCVMLGKKQMRIIAFSLRM